MLALLAITVTTVATLAQPGDRSSLLEPGIDLNPNFDIRTYKSDPRHENNEAAAAYVQQFASVAGLHSSLAASRLAGVAALEAAYKGIAVEDNPALGSTEVVSAMPGTGFLTPASGDRVATLRGFLTANTAAFGISAGQVAELVVVSDYMNPAGNMGWAELEQRLNGIPVFQGRIRGGFTAKGELVRTTGVLATGVDPSSLSAARSVSAGQAVALAADSVGWYQTEATLQQTSSEDDGARVTFARGTMADDAKAWLVYFPLAPGVVRLAWATEVWGDPDAFLTLIDAETGTMLFRKNMTEYQTQSATYNVYASDSPAPASPTTSTPASPTQAPFVPRQSFTLIGNEAPNTFNNLGWITDGTNGMNGHTDGNNVEAGIDRDGTNGVDAPVPGTNRVFNFIYDPETDSPLTAGYQNGDVTNMFYWTNRYHDSTYLLGFNEQSFNFQNDNFGRGGLGADRVSAEGQDSSGTNNANFATPADGGRGRMQMFIWTGPTPDRSGDLDQDVIYHELTHGTSNRLHGNASGLSNNMSRGMGEGWSDFVARSLLSDASEDVNGIYSIGGWATYQLTGAGDNTNYYYGIRRFPYAPRAVTGGPMNRPHSPLTFADIDSTQADLTDGAYPRGPVGSATVDQVHNIGEVWAGMLWEVRARFIARLGFAGNQRFLQFVMDGMKLDPVGPTLIQARDAIIAAANAGGGTAADIADIWAGFATRGLGFSAMVTNAGTGANNTRVVESFDTPGVAANGGTLVSESIPNGHLDPGEAVGVSLCLTNNGVSATGAVTGTLAASGGVTSPTGPFGYGVITPGANVCGNFTFTVSATCGATVTATLQVQEAGQPDKMFAYLFQVGGLTPSFTQNFDGVTAPALPTGWSTTTLTGTPNLWTTNTTTPDSAPNRAFAADPSTVSDNVLDSPSIALPAGVSRLSFRNHYDTESTFDGGVLEIAIGGGAFQDIIAAGGSFVSNGYNATISSSFGSPIGGRMAWSGNSGGYLTSVVDLPAAAGGQNVVLRWRMATDSSVTDVGWAVDTVTIEQFICSAASVPTTMDDVYATPFNTPLVVAAPGVLGNDTTNGGGAMTALLVTTSSGALGLNADGSFTYTPVGGFVGADSFTYRAVNGVGQGNVGTVTLNVAAPTTVQPPFNLRVESVVGNTVTLRWDTWPIGPQASTFILEGGVTPGSVLASIPTGSPATIFTVSVPTGSWVARIHGQLGADKSPASNEVALHVNVPVAPSAPANLLGLVNGSALSLAWKNTFGGGAPTGVMLDVTGSIATSLPLGPGESFGFTGVPAGTYTFSLRAMNAAGFSPSSNAVTLTFPGACSGAPEVPANLIGYRIGNVAYAMWDPPLAGPAPTAYTLNVTGSFVGSFVTPGRALSGVVAPGTYNVSVVATNACGASPASPVQVITVP